MPILLSDCIVSGKRESEEGCFGALLLFLRLKHLSHSAWGKPGWSEEATQPQRQHFARRVLTQWTSPSSDLYLMHSTKA